MTTDLHTNAERFILDRPARIAHDARGLQAACHVEEITGPVHRPSPPAGFARCPYCANAPVAAQEAAEASLRGMGDNEAAMANEEPYVPPLRPVTDASTREARIAGLAEAPGSAVSEETIAAYEHREHLEERLTRIEERLGRLEVRAYGWVESGPETFELPGGRNPGQAEAEEEGDTPSAAAEEPDAAEEPQGEAPLFTAEEGAGGILAFTPRASSNVRHLEYASDRSELRVRFRSGESYAYAAVPLETFEAVTAAESVGSAFHNLIRRAGYQATKLE